MACIYRTKNETCTYFDQKKKMRHASWPKKEKKTRHAHILKLKFDTFIRAKYIFKHKSNKWKCDIFAKAKVTH
jgi:hypothetical protein